MPNSTYDVLIKNATLWTSSPEDPLKFQSTKEDLAIKDGLIAQVGYLGEATAETTLDLEGHYVFPGFIDTQVHFREPGLEHKEDLATGTASAAAGGITAVFEMPNTSPNTVTANDFFKKVDRVKDRAWVDVAFYIGACKENADDLAELEKLDGCAGVKMFMGSSTGTLLVDDPETLEKVVLNGTRRFAVHCEDEKRLVERKPMVTDNPVTVHEHPNWRDETTAMNATQMIVGLAKKHNRQVHVLHVTTAAEMKFLADHKQYCSVECTPQHLTLSAPDCYDRLGTFAQMNPPVRTKEHQDALWVGVQNKVVDIIGSDHAPHTIEEKTKNNYPNTPSGMTGVQTSLPLMFNHINEGRLSYEDLMRLMIINPVQLFGVKHRGYLKPGYEGTLTIMNPNKVHTITNEENLSKSGWTPFDGMQVTGMPTHTIIRGALVMENGRLAAQPNGQMLEFENLAES